MRRRPLTAMLTALAALAASLSIAACGGKEKASGQETSTKTTSSSSLKAKGTEKKSSY
jgi:ABC-type glycerol-3-phosphate transport system substrate-binding protein